MEAYRVAIAVAVLTWGVNALAQSTTSTTMDLGSGMTHTDTMGPNGAMNSSNCMNMGGGMATCNTMNMSQPQRTYPTPDMSHPQSGGSGTLSMIADAIARSNERSFQKKVGALLATGDCTGAAKLAFAKGRLELGNKISAACTAPPAPAELESTLQRWVGEANSELVMPQIIDATTTATKLEALGTQIIFSYTISDGETTFPDQRRTKAQNTICAKFPPELLKAGLTVRIKYFDPSEREVGSVMITRSECGL
jgi:hypothetical protein